MKLYPIHLVGPLVAVACLLISGCGKPAKNSSQGHLHVLVVAPFTGPGASIGDYIRNGVEIARRDVQQRYGDALRLEIEFVDSKNQPQEGLSAYQSASLRSKPDAVICAMSSVSRALQPVAESDGVFMVATTTALSGLPEGTRHVIRVYPTSEDFVALTADFMAERFTKIAVLYVNDDFGRSNLTEFARKLNSKSKQTVVEESFELTQADHRTAIQRILGKGPDSVFVTGYGPAFIALVKQLREAAPTLPLFSEMSVANPAVLAALGSAAEGVIFAGTDLELTEPESKPARAFKAAYRTRFGTDTFMVAGFARDSLDLIVNAAFKDGAFAVPDKAEAIALSPFSGCIGATRLDAEGESHIPLKLMQRKGNQTVLLQP